jgi:hypothetical protein
LLDAIEKRIVIMPLTSEQPLTIVLGTGRCGSTMLSELLAMHPQVLSMSEFWNCFQEYSDEFAEGEAILPSHDMSGAEFWERLTNVIHFYDQLVTSGVKKDDAESKPFPSRFSFDTGMPSLALFLNRLTFESPDALYDELAPVVCSWPERPMPDHCRAFFSTLANRLGRRVIVERSGGSLKQINFLLEHFPDARYVFLHRDGPDTALSMNRYPTHRLAAFKYLAAAVAGSSSEPLDLDVWPEEIRSARPEDFEGLASPPFDKERFLTYGIPLTFFGAAWSSLTRQGTSEIRRVRQDSLLTLRYERLLRETRTELTRLADFIGVPADSPGISPDTHEISPDSRWLDLACGHVDTGRSGSAAAQLHPIDLAALRSVCAAGRRAFEAFESEQVASAEPRS